MTIWLDANDRAQHARAIDQIALAIIRIPAYPAPCSEVWVAVKDTLGNAENYEVLEKDEAKMKAAYKPKHSVHVNISGAILQRVNHVTLVPKGKGCEMQIGSNYSGWEHDDMGDFKKRVEQAMVKPKTEAPAEPAKQTSPTQ